MENIPYAHLEKGTLLIASPEVDKGLFFRSVLLLCEHTPGGSFGVMLNKPLEIEIPDEIISQERLDSPRIRTSAGGPVQNNQMMLLHSSNMIPEQTIEICSDVYLGGDLQFLQETLENVEGPHITLCFGYSGWNAGQLEREFLDGGWYLAKATYHHIFETPQEELWSTLLREMGGKYASLSTIPADLSLN
jgi:putative transcriptional regulator